MKTKTLALLEIAIVMCSVFLVALPAIAADQAMQKTITTASEDEFTLGIYGNANEDDTIDMRDTTYIKLVIFGKKPKTDLADANYDGKISMLDVGQTKLIILGKEKELTLIDLADRTVTINKPVERVVLTYSLEDFLAIGGKDSIKKLVGFDKHYFNSRPKKWQRYARVFPELNTMPDIGHTYSQTFSAEKVISLKPDIMLILKQEGFAPEDRERLGQAGIPVLTVDFSSEGTDEGIIKSILLIGVVWDEKKRAQELVDFYKEQVSKVYPLLNDINKPKPTVYLEGGFNKWHNTYGNYFWGAFVEKARGVNIAKDLVEKWGKINPEYILKADPDVIVGTSTELGYDATPEEAKQLIIKGVDRPGWEDLCAVKNKRIYLIQHQMSLHIYRFVGLQYLAKCFYPDEFEDIDPEENWKEFHERFLPIEYSGVWMLSLEE